MSAFQILESVSNANGKIQSAPLSNVIEVKYNANGNSFVKIGLHPDMARDYSINPENFVGMLILCDREQFIEHEEIIKKQS